MNLRPLADSKGFSLLEVITVFVLIGILFIAYIGYYRHTDTDLITQTHILKTNIRYAQARAMNSDTQWGLRYQSSGDQSEYWLFRDSQSDLKIAWPGQTDDSVRLDTFGLDISGSNFSLVFDSWGRPTASGRSFSGGQLSLTLNREGTPGDTITITENTGFIP